VTTLLDGSLEVFGIGNDHALWAIRVTGPTGSFSFGNWWSLGGYVTAIAAAPQQYGILQVFGIGSDNALWTLQRNGL
jgi:hypothetical protein